MQAAEGITPRVGDSIQSESRSFIERLAETLGTTAHASTIFGEPVVRNGITVIPVASTRWGFGGGGGQRREERGRGGGGGVMVQPVGFIEISDAGAEFRRIHTFVEPRAILSASIGFLLLRWLLKR
jgi:uncharacterized spore protein YtfJ